MNTENFILVGRFPVDVRCRVNVNAVVIYDGQAIKINQELDSPTFLYRNKDGFFVQIASQTNGGMILVHEKDVELFNDQNKQVDLYEVKVTPLGN